MSMVDEPCVSFLSRASVELPKEGNWRHDCGVAVRECGIVMD